MHLGETDLDSKLDGFKRISPSPTTDIYNFLLCEREVLSCISSSHI